MPAIDVVMLFIFSDEEQMNSEVDSIKERLVRLEEEIAETMRRLPAHSVKPPVMMDLLRLEDEREQLLQILKDR